MTDEEKQAIENLRKILFTTMQANECGLSNNDFKTEIKTYTDILGVIENQQAEIENLKTRKERQLKRFSKYKENIENKHEEIYEDLVQEIEKQDKIIDEMAKVLADYKYEELICIEVDCEHIELQNGGKCIGDKNCIKEYFKKKVEDK